MTGSYNRAHIYKIISQGGIAFCAGKRNFLYRHGLARKKRFVCKKLRGGKNFSVCGNFAPGGNYRYIAGHKKACRNLRFFSVTVNRRLWRGNSAQIFKGAFGTVFLQKAKHRVYKNNGHNSDGVDIFPKKKRNYRGAQQNQSKQIFKLRSKKRGRALTAFA